MTIDWNMPGADIAREITATSPQVDLLGAKVTLSSGRPCPRTRLPPAAQAGEFIVLPEGLEIACADGAIAVTVSAINVNDTIYSDGLLDFCKRYRLPTSGRVFADPHESFEATQLYARTTETVKERDGFRHGYFHKCLARNRRTAESLIRRLNLEPGAKVMDLACGTGWFAWLMAELGMDSHACDFFTPEYFPDSIRERVRYRTANIFEPWDGETGFDLVFLRDLTNEYRARALDPVEWAPLLRNLALMIGDRGAVYWVLMRGAKSIREFDRMAAACFPHREYRGAGYWSATLSTTPLPPSPVVPLPAAVTEEYCRHVFEDLEKNDRGRIARGVCLLLNGIFRSVEYDLSMPFVVHGVPFVDRYFELALHQLGLLARGGLAGLKKDERCVIVCGEQAPVSPSEYPLAVFCSIDPDRLISAWLNAPDVFACQDQDENFFARYLDKLHETR